MIANLATILTLAFGGILITRIVMRYFGAN